VTIEGIANRRAGSSGRSAAAVVIGFLSELFCNGWNAVRRQQWRRFSCAAFRLMLPSTMVVVNKAKSARGTVAAAEPRRPH